MKYVFTAQFLKVTPPETSFSDAWEAFCGDLLQLDLQNEECIKLKAPDRGIDLFLKNSKNAIQCKSDERGAFGSIQPAPSIESLTTANAHKDGLGWEKYTFATNASYSGKGLEQIYKIADKLELNRKIISFYGPEYWSGLCEKHYEKVKNRLDYRLRYTEEEVINAFKKARYFEERVKEYEALIKKEAYHIEIGNNRTPIRLEIPFSPSLTIEHCIDVAMQLLDLNIDAEKYSDLGTSAKPSYSITINQVPQAFKKKMAEYTEDELSKLELWIKIIWQEETEEVQKKDSMLFLQNRWAYKHHGDFQKEDIIKDRGKETIDRFEGNLQSKMWDAICS